MGRGTNRISCSNHYITNDDLKTEEIFPMTGEPFPVRILFPLSRLIPYFSPHAKFDIYRNIHRFPEGPVNRPDPEFFPVSRVLKKYVASALQEDSTGE